MYPSICLIERTCHSTSLTTFHSTSTKNLTTLHALLATFHNLLIDDCPRFRTTKNPLTKQHQSIRKPSTTADTTTFSHFLHIIWYNPPFSKNVSTNIGRTFLKLLDTELTKEHVLHKIFNRNTVKISYSCMPNLKQNIDDHNKSILHNKIMPPRSCNCRVKTECPLSGKCLKESVVYQATVSTEDHNPPQTYVGLTENSFKTRYSNHKSSFPNANKRHNSELRKYIWGLKDELTKFTVTWRILKHATSYNPTYNRCNLCLWEKYFIICKPDLASLNKRNELISSCRQAGKYALKNLTP